MFAINVLLHPFLRCGDVWHAAVRLRFQAAGLIEPTQEAQMPPLALAQEIRILLVARAQDAQAVPLRTAEQVSTQSNGARYGASVLVARGLAG